MESELENTFDFVFGIVGDQLELTDDEDLVSQIPAQASKVEPQRQQESSFTAWREDLADQFQGFLLELIEELQPRQDDHLARLNIVGRLSSVLADMDSFRGAKLSTFGSFESNFYTPWSDVDLSLELPDRDTLLEPISKKVKVRVLSSLSRTLTRKGEACKVQFIPFARVPLITFEDTRHKISCDISVENDAAILKSRFLRWIGEVDSRCRDLVFLVKCWAKAHGINDPKQGTLNSFALCLLVIFHLQTRSPPVLPPLSAVLDEDIVRRLKGSKNSTEEILKSCEEKIQPFIDNQFGAQNKSSVAELFITFFNQFSAVRDLWNQGLAICTFTGAWGDRRCTSAKWRSKSYLMAIEDPFDRWENCARSVHVSTFGSIMMAFTTTASTLQRPVPSIDLPCLLESLFLWPVDAQALGRPAWLAKVHSKVGPRKRPPLNTDAVNGSKAGFYASRKLRSKAYAIQQSHYQRPNNREVGLEAFLEKTLEGQLRGRLQLDNSGVPAVKQKKERKKKPPPVSTKESAVVGIGIPGSNLSQHSERVERVDSRTQAIEDHLHQILNISRVSVLENSVEALTREEPQVSHLVIGGTSKEKKKKHGIPAASSGNGGRAAGHDCSPENRAEDSLIQVAELNPLCLEMENNLCIEGVASSQKKPLFFKGPQRSRRPAVGQESQLDSLLGSYNPEGLRPAIQGSTRDHPGTSSTEDANFQVLNPFIETKSYVSAMKNGNRQSKFNRGGSTLANDGVGILPRPPGMAVPVPAKRRGGARSSYNLRQGEVRFETPPQSAHVSKVWTPRNMPKKYTGFSPLIEGHKDRMVAVGGSGIDISEPLLHHD